MPSWKLTGSKMSPADRETDSFKTATDVFFQPSSGVTERASETKEPTPSPSAPPTTPLREGFIDSRFKVMHEDIIPELSTEFAKACRVTGRKQVEELKLRDIYGLIFHPKYPAPANLIRFIQQQEHPMLPRIVDEGKIEIAGVARYMVILEKPVGISTAEYVKQKTAIPEAALTDLLLTPLFEALNLLHGEGFIHGSLNADTLYFDEETRLFRLTEFFSNYQGSTQKNGYETVNRLLVHPVAKSGKDKSADYYALGVLLSHLISGREPLSGFSKKQIIEHRMQNGSYDITVFEIIKQKAKLSGRLQQLLRALLKDQDNERWGEEQVGEWLSKKVSNAVSAPKTFKETTSPFVFQGEKYYSRKHLAQAMFENWAEAKMQVKPPDLERWVRLSIKQTPAAEKIETVFAGHLNTPNLVISDDKMVRLLMLLDPEGPIRYKNYAVNLYGLGTFLSYGFYRGDREMVQFVGDVFNERVIEFWQEVQQSQEGYSSPASVPWAASKEAQYLRKAAFGFGIERCLYDMNPTLSCQSALVVDDYVVDLQGLLNILNEKAATKRPDSDPMDRHIAAFIANRIDLLDEIRIKAIQRFPELNKNPQVNMLALLTVAQSHGRIKALKGLAAWMSVRLGSYVEMFHSDSFRREIRSKLDKATREGNLNAMFKVISDPTYPTRDVNGYIDAKAQYRMMEDEIRKLGNPALVERHGYHHGLRAAMLFSYVVLAATTLLALARIE
jgi:hypothetical protein